MNQRENDQGEAAAVNPGGQPTDFPNSQSWWHRPDKGHVFIFHLLIRLQGVRYAVIYSSTTLH